MKKDALLSLVVLLLGVSGLTSCMGSRNATRSSSKAYVQYYRNDSTNLYFLKPFNFKDKKSGEYGTIDFTFEVSNDSVAEVRANFSLFLIEKRKIADVSLAGKDQSYVIPAPKSMFREVFKKYFHYRYTSQFPYQALQQWVEGTETKMVIEFELDPPLILLPTSSSQKKISSLQQDFFDFVVP